MSHCNFSSLCKSFAAIATFATAVSLASASRAEPSPISPVVSAPDTRSADRNRMGGAFTYVGSKAELADLDAAIEKSVADFSFFTKGAARSKLREMATPKAWMRLSFVDGTIVVAQPGSAPTVSPDSGAPRTLRSEDGQDVRVAQRLFGRTLVQNVSMPGGSSHIEYTLGADDRTLTVRVRTLSPKLSAPLVYTLTYRR